MDLKIIAEEIKELLKTKRDEICLTFEEENHIYEMKDINGIIRNDFPSVSTVIKWFHDEFDSQKKSLEKARGDLKIQKQLLFEWSEKGRIATNMGSRVHYNLEQNLIKLYDNYKEVRQPIFECEIPEIEKGNKMIIAGDKFIELMHKRGAILLDTEIVLGSSEMGYVGQPDKVWLFLHKGKLCIIITDWKSNKPENFEIKPWTNKMYEPFEKLNNNALGHYTVQLPMYAKLLIDMLKGTKYEDIRLLGCIIVLLKDDETFEEFKVPQYINDIVLNMNMKDYSQKKELN